MQRMKMKKTALILGVLLPVAALLFSACGPAKPFPTVTPVIMYYSGG